MGARRAVLACALVAALGPAAIGCGEKKKETPVAPPPVAPGAASTDELVTGLGSAKGLPAELAPTSTEWRRALVLDDKRAFLFGEVVGKSVALVTKDGGRTFRALEAPAADFTTWSAGANGTLAATFGARAQPKAALRPGQRAPVAGLRIAVAQDDALGAPATPIAEDAKKKPVFPSGLPLGAVVNDAFVAFVAEDAPRKPSLFYASPSGLDGGTPLSLAGPEAPVPSPYGRPPSLLFAKGGALVARAVPEPGGALGAPRAIAGFRADPGALGALAEQPACETGALSYQLVTSGGRPFLVGVGPDKAAAVPLPPTTVRTSPVGCFAERAVVLTQAPNAPIESLALCGLDGKCTEPPAAPFRPWPVAHQRRLFPVVTAQGVVAVMRASVSDRWGLYVTQSLDGGKLYELPRVLGEGQGSRGRVDVHAVLSFGSRVLLLLSADVTGTSRRGFYTMVSDDGGTSWGPP